MQTPGPGHRTGGLRRNLSAGARLATGRAVATEDFDFRLPQLGWLAAVIALVELGLAYLLTPAPAVFDPYGLGYLGTAYLLDLLVLLALGLTLGVDAGVFGRLVVVVLAARPLQVGVTLGAYAAAESWPEHYADLALFIYAATLAWQVFVWAAAVQLLAPVPRLRAAGYAAAGGLVLAASLWLVPPAAPWYPGGGDAASGLSRALWQLNAEDLFYAQDALMAENVDVIQPHRPGVTDLYLLGFAGDGSETVFLNEVEYVRALFDRSLGTQDRSVLLANHPRTIGRYPLANHHNLAAALRVIGTRIDPAEDLVVVFLTSHGSADHRLAVDLGPIRMHDLSPTRLRRALDEAGIRWRVIIVSSCYSGGFIEPLRDPYTLVVTAAAPDRESFGCGARSQFTDFGTAYFKEGLPRTGDFIAGFELAARLVAEREAQERRPPSQPQLYAGNAIRAKLAALGPLIDRAAGQPPPQ